MTPDEFNREMRKAGDLSIAYWAMGIVCLVSGLAVCFS